MYNVHGCAWQIFIKKYDDDDDVMERSRVRVSPTALQAADAHQPLSPTSVIWYWSKGADVLQLER